MTTTPFAPAGRPLVSAAGRAPRPALATGAATVEGPWFRMRLARAGAGLSTVTTTDAYTLVVPLHDDAARSAPRCGDLAWLLDPGASVPAEAVPACDLVLLIRMERDLVASELRSLCPRGIDSDVSFDRVVHLAEAPTDLIATLVDDLASQLHRASGRLHHPAIWLRQVRTVLAACLVHQPHTFSSLVTDGRSPARPRHLRRSLDHIEAHLADHLTLEVLADAAGCSARTLSTAFRVHLGATPMTYVRNRRLDRVRADLSTHDDLIASVAYRWGFTHLGRFSSYYHQRFGERPSETLSRAGSRLPRSARSA